MENKEQVLKIFAKKLKELLKENNLNNSTFAAKCGIPRTTINSWTECKKIPKADALLVVAEFFNVSVDFLLGREDF